MGRRRLAIFASTRSRPGSGCSSALRSRSSSSAIPGAPGRTTTIILIGVAIGLLAGIIAGIWVDAPRRPRLARTAALARAVALRADPRPRAGVRLGRRRSGRHRLAAADPAGDARLARRVRRAGGVLRAGRSSGRLRGDERRQPGVLGRIPRRPLGDRQAQPTEAGLRGQGDPGARLAGRQRDPAHRHERVIGDMLQFGPDTARQAALPSTRSSVDSPGPPRVGSCRSGAAARRRGDRARRVGGAERREGPLRRHAEADRFRGHCRRDRRDRGTGRTTRSSHGGAPGPARTPTTNTIVVGRGSAKAAAALCPARSSRCRPATRSTSSRSLRHRRVRAARPRSGSRAGATPPTPSTRS